MVNGFDILFLSKLFPKETEKEVRSKAKVDMQDAANVLEWQLVEGLEENNENGMLKIVNILPIGSFPGSYQDYYVPTSKFQHAQGAEDINVGFLNLKFIKQLFRGKLFYPIVISWAKKRSLQGKVIISYSLDNVFLKAIKKAKKKNDKIIACAVVADLPQFITSGGNVSLARKLFFQINLIKTKKLVSEIDCFVLLTKHMNEALNSKKPFIVMEGIAAKGAENTDNKESDSYKTVLYTGSLNILYGIKVLLEAFHAIEDINYRLIICGLGNAESLVNEYCRIDDRIIFKGHVSHDDVVKLQQKATVVVNPRQNIEVFTRYSFPSKNLEYLSSGTPLIAYKLDGIPDEYDEYIQYVTDNSAQELTNKMIEICEKTPEELKKIGKKARDFVTANKNRVVQTNKILYLINECRK